MSEYLNLEIEKSLDLKEPLTYGHPISVSRVQNIVFCKGAMIFSSKNGLLVFDAESGKFISRADELKSGYRIDHIIKWKDNTIIVCGNEPLFRLCSFLFVGNVLKIEKNFTDLTNLSGILKCYRILKISNELFCFETKQRMEIVDYKTKKILYVLTNHLQYADSFSRLFVSLKYENSIYFTNYRISNSNSDVLQHVRYTDNKLLGRYGFEDDEMSQIYDLNIYKNKRDQEILIMIVSDGLIVALSEANGKIMPRESFTFGIEKDQYAGSLHILQKYMIVGTSDSKLLFFNIENFSTKLSPPLFSLKKVEDRSKELEIKELQISSTRSTIKEVGQFFDRGVDNRINYTKGGFLFVVHGTNVTKIKVSGLSDPFFLLGLEDLKERISFLFDLEGITPGDIFIRFRDQGNLFFEIDCSGTFGLFKCLKIFLL